MSNKRLLHTTSPEYTERTESKRYLTSNNMPSSNLKNSSDVFSWDKLCKLLDEKLSDVTRKSDLNELKAEIDELKQENAKLKEDVNKLTSRLEFIDRRSRSSNIVVSGLNSKNNNSAKQEVENLCNNVLKVNANIMSTRMIAGGKSFCFTLASSFQAYNVTAVKKKLKGKNIFINKDYTVDEQNVRYNLRKLSKSITKCNKTVKVRLGEFCIYVDNKKYTYKSDKIETTSNSDAIYLRKLLANTDYATEIDVINVNQPIANLPNTSIS